MSRRNKNTVEARSKDTRRHRILRRILLIVSFILVAGLIGTQLASMILGNATLAKPGEAVTSVMTPVQSGFSSVVDWVVNYLQRLKLRSRIELEYNSLKQENEQLMYNTMLVEELQYKLNVYEKLYDEISVNESMNPLVATVIGRESGNYFSVFTINKGSDDGVEDYMAVTMDGALVGYTYNVTAKKSTVRTIIDSEASIAGLISSSRDQGTVRGTLGVDGTPNCRMYYLSNGTLPRPGDKVVTSGVGLSFPKGIPIGTVRESTRGMESNKQYIVVEPLADFQHIEYVIVLRYQPEPLEVQDRSGKEVITITPLDTPVPIPTVQIGNDFYQLAPTPEPTAEPQPTTTIDDFGNEITITPAPYVPESESYEYQVPGSDSNSDDLYRFTLAPTASPTPTPPPLDLSVEED